MRQRKEKEVLYKLSSAINLLEKEKRMHQLSCPIIGLTGGIATGKSTVARFFSDKGFPLISADSLVKEIYKKKEVIEYIKSSWPDVFEHNNINFKRLRNIAFSNIENRTSIEELIYSYLPDEFKKEFNKFSKPQFVIYDVPLLFEKKLNLLIDYSIVVYAPASSQLERLQTRDQITPEQAKLALSNQIDIEKKIKLADYLIMNTEDLDYLSKQVKKFITEILSKRENYEE
jgi:dephospho-CoA kinase